MIIPYVPPATCQGTRSLCLPFWHEGYADCGCGPLPLEWRCAVRLGIEIGCRHRLSSGPPFPHLTSSSSTLGNTLKIDYLVLSLGAGDTGGVRGFVGIKKLRSHVQERKPSCPKSKSKKFLRNLC